MSKATGLVKIRVEEENAKYNKAKKFGVSSTDQSKRALLADVQNRAGLRVASNQTGKDAAQKSLAECKFQNNFRNAKARVDTHRKKSEHLELPAASDGSGAAKATSNVDMGLGQRKLVTRSHSQRVANAAGVAAKAATSSSSNGLSLHRQASVHLHKPPTTLTTKMIDNKAKQVKYVTTKQTIKIMTEERIVLGANSLRREDSNLSRRSLSKLKAALQRDADGKTAAVVSKPVAKVVAVQKQKEVAVAAKSQKAPPPPQAKLQIHNVQSLQSRFSAVEDIDAGDGENLILVSEYVNDIYNYLFDLEEKHAIRENHLEGQIEVYPKTRAVLIDWINEVHLQFRLVGDTFQIAVAIIDRYLQTVKDTKRSLLQLVGVTALFIAAKYEELFPPAIADFVYITDNTYTTKQILQMELQIFKALDCNLSRPLPLHFLRRFSKAADAEDLVHGMAKYFVELALGEYDLSWYKPSEIAAASLYLTLHLLRGNAKNPTGFDKSHWNPTLEWHSHYSAAYLKPIARKIAQVARNAPNAKLKAVYQKHQTSKFHKLSLRTELYGPLMESLINRQDD